MTLLIRSFRLCAALALFGILAADARGQDSRFDEGNRLYQAGDYAAALNRYEQIVADGREAAALYYNIGNAHFKLGELGKAILAWERARRLAPGDADVTANLALARSMTADEIRPVPQFWLFQVASWWVGALPRTALLLVVGLAYVVSVGCLVSLIARPEARWAIWVRRLAAGSAVVTLVFGINLLVRELGIGRAEEAIVMAPEVKVQSAPSDDSALQIFTVHEGTRVRIDRESAPWVEVALEDGKVGWVKGEVLERI